MSEMIERVTQAIIEAGYNPATANPIARIAISSMRNPTEAMVQRGRELILGNLRPEEIFPYMIDAEIEQS